MEDPIDCMLERIVGYFVTVLLSNYVYDYTEMEETC